MKRALLGRGSSKAALSRLIEAPNLVQALRALAPRQFAELVRHVGVEDAGELLPLCTTPQLVAAFDEDLFVSERAGEQETFDRNRFAVWLEVLLEAGDAAAAARVAELSEAFVVQALSSLVLVLDNDALLARLGEGGDDADLADKAIESCLSEEVEGYLLLSKGGEGWDALLALVLALDWDHHTFLERVLSRAATMNERYVDDLDELSELLSEAESLAEDVEAEREERRAEAGFVEPRAAKAFLTLSRAKLVDGPRALERDALTKGYFRNLPKSAKGVRSAPASYAAQDDQKLLALLGEHAMGEHGTPPKAETLLAEAQKAPQRSLPLGELAARNPTLFALRMDELAYLANTILAGSMNGSVRFEPPEAAEAALATVALGAEHEAGSTRQRRSSAEALLETLESCNADFLFRLAASTLVAREPSHRGFLLSLEELDAALP